MTSTHALPRMFGMHLNASKFNQTHIGFGVVSSLCLGLGVEGGESVICVLRVLPPCMRGMRSLTNNTRTSMSVTSNFKQKNTPLSKALLYSRHATCTCFDVICSTVGIRTSGKCA